MLELIKTAIVCGTIVACMWILMKADNNKKGGE